MTAHLDEQATLQGAVLRATVLDYDGHDPVIRGIARTLRDHPLRVPSPHQAERILEILAAENGDTPPPAPRRSPKRARPRNTHRRRHR